MIRLMIVDDEHIVREGIKFILDKSFSESIKIVAMAKSGREAIEMFEETRAQIVLMDIQMPGINGIDAIATILNIDPHVRCVIISAYEQFEYAKSAVKLGVEDYILKPINKGKLTAVFDKLIFNIQEDKKNKQREIEIQEKLDKVLPILEYGYVYSVLMNHDFEKENNDYHSLLNIQKEYGYVMVIELGEGANHSTLENRIGTSVKSNIQYQKIRNAIKYKCKAIIGPLMVNRIVAIVNEDMPTDEYQHRVKAIELAESIHESLTKLIEYEVFIGIGSCYKTRRINVSYSEALKAISKMTDEKILHIKDAVKSISEEKTYNFIKVKSDQENIVHKIEEGNIYDVEQLLELFFSKLSLHYMDNMDVIYNVVTELMVLIYTSGYRNGIFSMEDQTMHYVDEIKEISEFYQLKNWSITRAKEITNSIKSEKETKVSSVIGEAMNYIEEHFGKDLRLKDVAMEVSISPQYFSKIFKEELGVNFIDYLTNVRIEQAKKMLKDKTLSIKEICFMIGYNDPNYFSRLFKKIEGISPTDY